MKKILYILTFFIMGAVSVKAQNDDGADDRIRDKMREFIQRRMDLSKNEAEKFTPVFVRYFREWRTTLRDYKGDRLVLQQKIIDLKLRYRPEFKEILGEKRGGEVYKHQQEFIKELDNVRQERVKDRLNNKPQRIQRLSPL